MTISSALVVRVAGGLIQSRIAKGREQGVHVEFLFLFLFRTWAILGLGHSLGKDGTSCVAPWFVDSFVS